MSLPLRYGDAPEGGPDIGKIVPPKRIENSKTSGLGGVEALYNAYGLPLSDWAKIRWVLWKLEGQEKPYQVQVAGLGSLIVGKDGWKVI